MGVSFAHRSKDASSAVRDSELDAAPLAEGEHLHQTAVRGFGVVENVVSDLIESPFQSA